MVDCRLPIGSDNEDAPWNEKSQSPEEIEVTVSITLSKTISIKVDDYNVISEGVDEDNIPFKDIDFKDCDLEEAVRKQVRLPHKAYKYVLKGTPVYNDLEGWVVDDFVVVHEN